jgi:hypothetical protein
VLAKRKIKFMYATLAVALLVFPSMFLLLTSRASGATLTTTYIRLNRMKAGQTTSFRLVFKAASSQTANVAINFNGADSVTWTGSTGTVNATQSVTTAQCVTDTGFTALPGSITASGSGSTVTIASVGATTAAATYCVDLTSTSAVTNATAGEYHPTVTIGTDSVTTAVRTISEDQVVVTATVPPTFNFVFNNTTTDAFGNLSTTAITSTTGKTITLTTNANSGWIVWAKSTQGTTKGSLNSTTAGNYKITSSSALGSASHTMTNNTEDYGLAVTINTDAAGGGVVALDAAYDGTTTKVGVLDSQNFRPVATANGTANGDIINVLERATIQGSTPAANDYTDTITFIGAGNF